MHFKVEESIMMEVDDDEVKQAPQRSEFMQKLISFYNALPSRRSYVIFLMQS